MALKRQHDTDSMFSMSSMTDVVFLLLIFFMVTSTFVFPSAVEVNLPQSSQNTPLKPTTRIYIDSLQHIYVTEADSLNEGTARMLEPAKLVSFMENVKKTSDAEHQFVALHADESVPYGSIVDILDKGARVGLKVVLATKPSSEIDPAAAEVSAETPKQE